MTETLIPLIIAFALCAALGPFLIALLKKNKARQTVRDDGPGAHLVKAGTPTMGGILIITATIAGAIYYAPQYPKIIPVLIMMLAFGLVGFWDDFIKVKKIRSLGLRAWQKLLAQLIITAVFIYYLSAVMDISLAQKIPFAEGRYWDMGPFAIPFLLFVALGTVNGANLTDGLDGLHGSVTALIAVTFSIMSVGINAGISPVAAAMAGALMGFLIYNAYPARIFMGDTGSLALGAFVFASAYLTQTALFIPIMALVYVVEAASVLLQVGYFKLSGGKRIFKMSPIHHHFELCGFFETKVVSVFVIVTALLCAVALLGVW